MSPPPETEPSAVIEMAGVTVGSLANTELTVIEDVNWSVSRGEYWVVAGMHNSGKSDFLALAAGLMPPRAGSYHFLGREMPIYEEEFFAHRLRLSLVFGDGHLLRRLTIAENIALPLRYHGPAPDTDPLQRLRELLELTELTPWADFMPGELGPNWQKRAGLARALALGPELLLLDNPLGGLDLRHTHWWLGFLAQLSAGHPFFGGRKMTLAATAEDLRPWRNRASHFAVLEKRRLIVLGQRSVLAGHEEPLVKELLAEEASDT